MEALALQQEQCSHEEQIKPLCKPMGVCRFCTFRAQDVGSCQYSLFGQTSSMGRIGTELAVALH
jgi:hypothetical protein